jgi:hypothetical protein
MNLKLRKVEYAGDLEKERVIIDVKGDDDLNNYMIVDNTFNNEGEPSNKHRHLYKFPKQSVKKGDLIVLFSKEGKNRVINHDGDINQYNFYWNNSTTSVWNKGIDKCHLIKIENHKSIDVE